MNALIVLFAACVAVASAGLHGGYIHSGYTHGGVLQGPGSHAAVVGPDGSQIVASEHGGAIVSDVAHGYSAHHVAVPAVHAVHGVHGVHAVHAVPAVHAYGLHGVHAYAHEGQYVPSGLELLHDDGSYRAEHHHAELLHHY